MSIARPDDIIAVGKTRRGNFLAVLIPHDTDQEQDDCHTFLFKSTWAHSYSQREMSLIAARRLLTDNHVYNVSLDSKAAYWADLPDGGTWLHIPLKGGTIGGI
jgi:hypothetical protein